MTCLKIDEKNMLKKFQIHTKYMSIKIKRDFKTTPINKKLALLLIFKSLSFKIKSFKDNQ